jgi:glycerol-3-phosphate dehydrogenase
MKTTEYTRSKDAGLDCDVLVVGGGINGTGIARDLSGRGLSVVLCEKDDLAGHTSSASTKLIHGGLRYLEYYEFSLVRKALAEREVLLRSAPHIMWPLRFVMPHNPSMRPAWMIRAGLFLYDNLASRELLPGSEGISLRRHAAGAPLKEEFKRGFAYSDAWVDDARLVVLNAVDAATHGATVLTRTECVELHAESGVWCGTLKDGDGDKRAVRARSVVNATGPWADRFLRTQTHRQDTKRLRLIKGSHIVVPRLFDHAHAYLFQNTDGRIIFAIPYEHEFTLIGTTDVEYTSGLDSVGIDTQEIAYLCEQASRYFKQPIRVTDVVWSYSGVRPLIDDESGNAAAVTRDYRLELHQDGPPFLTIWGGKITTYRKLAQEAANVVAKSLGRPTQDWTAPACLPGGDLTSFIGPAQRPDTDFVRFVGALARRYPWLPARMLQRLSRAYGARIVEVLGKATCIADLGEMVAPDVTVAELDYLRRAEWARTGDDVLWRRSKLGLHLSAEQRTVVAAWMDCRAVAQAADVVPEMAKPKTRQAA